MMEPPISFWLCHPIRLYQRFLDKFFYPATLAARRNVRLLGRVILRGCPTIDVSRNGLLTIGHNVVLNSRNLGYHGNLFGKVKLFVEDHASISIGNNTRIHGSCIHARESIKIGEGCLIAGNTQIFDSNGHDVSFDDVTKRIATRGTAKSILISDHVWIGMNCIILPGVAIGTGSVVAAGSVVTKPIPPMVVAGGNPARVIKQRAQPLEEGFLSS